MAMPKKIAILTVLLVVLGSQLVLLTSCAVVVRRPPRPAARIEVVAPRPHHGAAWVKGHWQWRPRAGQWIWVPGHWRRR